MYSEINIQTANEVILPLPVCSDRDMMRILVIILKPVVTSLTRWFALIYNYSKSRSLKDYYNVIYTIWLGKFIGKLGDKSIIHYPFKSSTRPSCLYIGNNTVIHEFCVIEPVCEYNQQVFESMISIGDNCDLGAFNHITSVGKIVLGNGILTGRRVLISNNNHGDFSEDSLKTPPVFREILSKGDLIIEDDVWIGEGASLLGGLHIGKGAVIGANSVVTRNVPSYTLVAGNPARVIKQLNPSERIS